MSNLFKRQVSQIQEYCW